MSSDKLTEDPCSPIVYMALSMLCSNQNSLVPEILYIMKPDQIINFIKVFGGESLRIPTPDEFSRDLMSALACYHVVVEGKSWDWLALKYEFDGNYMRSLKNRVESWWNNLAPGEREFIYSLKPYQEAREKEARLGDESQAIEWL